MAAARIEPRLAFAHNMSPPAIDTPTKCWKFRSPRATAIPADRSSTRAANWRESCLAKEGAKPPAATAAECANFWRRSLRRSPAADLRGTCRDKTPIERPWRTWEQPRRHNPQHQVARSTEPTPSRAFRLRTLGLARRRRAPPCRECVPRAGPNSIPNHPPRRQIGPVPRPIAPPPVSARCPRSLLPSTQLHRPRVPRTTDFPGINFWARLPLKKASRSSPPSASWRSF